MGWRGGQQWAEVLMLRFQLFPFRIPDPDVLDTWFSSALFPFSALGWPREVRWVERKRVKVGMRKGPPGPLREFYEELEAPGLGLSLFISFLLDPGPGSFLPPVTFGNGQ